MKTRFRWWLPGLVLAAVILGHDALMATDAHAAASDRPSGAIHHQGGHAGVAAVPHDSRLSGDRSRSNSDGACTTTQLAVAPDAPVCPSVQAAVAGLPASHPPLAQPSPAPTSWVEPGKPPGTRRALLQVFRI